MTEIDPYEFILQPGGNFIGNKLKYLSGIDWIEIERTECYPHNYTFDIHTPLYLNKYSFKGVRMYGSTELLDLGLHPPLENVEQFRVYYRELENKTPLLICMQIANEKNGSSYRYYCPRNRDRKSWMEVPGFAVDFKSENNHEEIKKKLLEIASLMDGVEIDIEKTYDYTDRNINIKVYDTKIGSYYVYTHQLNPPEPFHLKEINFQFKPLHLDKLTPEQVISVNVYGTKLSSLFKPIAIRVDKHVKEEHNIVKKYDWYCLNNRSTNQWVWEERFAEKYDEFSIIEYLNKRLKEAYYLDINITKKMFDYTHGKEIIINDIRGSFMIHKNFKSKFTKYIYILSSPRKYTIRSFKIDDKLQNDLSTELYSHLYIFCHEKNDKHVPVFLCFELDLNKHKWYRPEYYSSNKWVECYELTSCDPRYNVSEILLEREYSLLFWITVDIQGDRLFIIKDYINDKRLITETKIERENYIMFELSNKYEKYPFYARIFKGGQPLKEIDFKHQIKSVYVLYYKHTLEPVFAVFDPVDKRLAYSWFAKYSPNYDVWYHEQRLWEKDPKNANLGLLTPYDPVFYYDDEDMRRMAEQKSISYQAVGASAATAACCGAGYLLYTNASHISELFTSLFH